MKSSSKNFFIKHTMTRHGSRMGDPLGSPRVASLLFFFPLKFGLILPVRTTNLFVFPLGGNKKGGEAWRPAFGV